MKATQETIDYENRIPRKITIQRCHDISNPQGFYEIKIKTYDNKLYQGIIYDDYVLDLLKKYERYYKHEKYKYNAGR